jgi:hypothetical protein
MSVPLIVFLLGLDASVCDIVRVIGAALTGDIIDSSVLDVILVDVPGVMGEIGEWPTTRWLDLIGVVGLGFTPLYLSSLILMASFSLSSRPPASGGTGSSPGSSKISLSSGASTGGCDAASAIKLVLHFLNSLLEHT